VSAAYSRLDGSALTQGVHLAAANPHKYSTARVVGTQGLPTLARPSGVLAIRFFSLRSIRGIRASPVGHRGIDGLYRCDPMPLEAGLD
jgi:hypothetical protein